MIIKKFQAATENEAIMLAKNELGKDAIVMNIKYIKPKGIYKLFKKASVEVTAAVDEENSYTDGKKMLSEIKKINDNSVSTSAPVNPSLAKKEVLAVKKEENPLFSNPNIIIEPEEEEKKNESETAIERRLNELQYLLEAQMKVKKETDSLEREQEEKTESKNEACIKLISEKLIQNEVDELYAAQLIKEIEKGLNADASVDNILSTVYQKIILKIGQPKPIEVEEGKTKFIYFVGSTGVGKTTTIAKIAASLKLKRKAKIAMVTSDTYRIAAVEQLRTYANILGVPVKVVYTETEMEDVKREFAGYDIVLIDTAGRSHHNEEQKEDIKRLIEAIPKEEREVYLVLSATTKYKDLLEIAKTYEEITDYNLIFTKLDESDCIGNLFNIKMATGVPLSYTTWGQNVPDDIGQIDAQNIAKKLLGGNR